MNRLITASNTMCTAKGQLICFKILFLFALTLFDQVAYAQNPDAKWYQANKKHNRYEGFRPQKVSGKVDLISFTLGVIPAYEAVGTSTAHLFVKFFAPDPTTRYSLSAKTMKGTGGYYMEDLLTLSPYGWHEFGPWEADMVLLPSKVYSKDLGVIVARTQKQGAQDTIFPAKVYLKSKINSDSYYLVALKPNNTIQNLTIKVKKGNEVVHTFPTEPKIMAENPHLIKIPLSKLTDERYYKVELVYRRQGEPYSNNDVYFFFHKKYEK